MYALHIIWTFENNRNKYGLMLCIMYYVKLTLLQKVNKNKIIFQHISFMSETY